MPEYQNPQQEPGTERRLLLVFALTFLVITLFQPLYKKYFPQPATPPAQSQSQPQSQPGNAAIAVPASVAPTATPANSAGVAGRQASAESEVVVENAVYRITFSNRGAQVKSWVLKNYNNDSGQPLNLVNSNAPKYGYPLSLWTYDETLRNQLNSALFICSREGTLSAPGEIAFDYADQNLTIRKVLHFDNSYVIHVETSVISHRSYITAIPAWPAGFGDQVSGPAYAAGKIEYQSNDNIERLAIKKISGGATLPGPFLWAGTSDQYFAAAFLPQDPQNDSLITLRNAIDVPKDSEKPNSQDTTKADVLGVAVGNLKGPTSIGLYAGPKSLQVLEATPMANPSGPVHDLRGLVDLGWLGLISRPLFIWLKWTHDKIIPNWGWAIVLQTIVINLALLPLRISSMKSALKMQRVQPQMNSIKDKYKKYTMRDPRRQEMNTEIGELMKREGVNPVGGCLPLIIQMPFLFAYYRMLSSAIDLRQAHWLWIHDLSSADPYYLLPITLVLSMMITQRMTPQTGMDPAQQKMMAWTMPLMMGFIFYKLAAGLNLYYSLGNLISIGQQSVMNRTGLGREMREMALKRARKKEK